MNNTRLLSLIRKEFVQILRDPRTLALVIVIPVLQLFLLGYSASNDVRNVPMAVFNQDRGPAARELLDAFRVADQFAIRFEVYSEDELPADQEQFLKLNEELSRDWPVITEMKDPPEDADEWREVKDKLQYLER